MLEDDEMFCHECGTKQEIEETEAQVEEPSFSEEKFCVHCGKAIEIDSMFCSFCGKPQDVENVEAEHKEKSRQEPSEQPKQPEQPEEAQETEEPEQSEQSDQHQEPQKPEVEEQPTYEWEEETSSRKWLWILLALLVAGGIGAWYYMSDGGASGGRSQFETVDSDLIAVVDTSAVYNDVVPSSPLAFLEEFYKGNYEDSEYIKQHVTANVLNKLKQDAEKDGRSGLLAAWVFNAYDTGTDGPDLEYEEGPMIVNTNEQDKFCVVYQYNYYDEPKLSRARKVYLTVSDIDAKYLISDYEVESSSSDNTSSIDENIGSSITMKGKVSKYGIHMVLDINIEDVNGYYYYDSQGSENRVMLKGTLADGKLKLKKYDKDGNVTGYFEGEFDGTSYQGDNVNYNRDEALPFIVEIVN